MLIIEFSKNRTFKNNLYLSKPFEIFSNIYIYLHNRVNRLIRLTR